MASCLGLPREHCQGELSPEEKAARVRELDAHDTLYVGDGANDSLAFDVAWCTGTPALSPSQSPITSWRSHFVSPEK
jgi:Cu2+-exporting ATPase